MKIMKWLFGVLFMMVIMALTIVVFARTSLLIFLDIPSLVLVLICPFGLLLIQYGPSRFARYFSAAFGSRPVEAPIVKKSEFFFRKLGHYFLLTGGVFFITGIIMALSDISNTEAIGVNLAVALLTLLYGLLLDMLLAQPLVVFCREKLLKDEII